MEVLALRLDAPASILLALVAVLGVAIARFAFTALEGDPRRGRHLAAVGATIAAVAVVAVTDHLAVLVAAWAACSLAVHRLLLHFPERTMAQVAAHKKFLASRLAEACLVAAAALIHHAAGTLSLSGLERFLAASPTIPSAIPAAAVLVALAVLLKTAQLPAHGWLVQVMEAPTPVSALLHAGVVNLGGFVVIRLAALFEASPAAQGLLVAVGGATAVVAALAMLTRVTVKVRLAWSTCAQMGFMMVECGLGLYDLAMLHLVGHSLYKAHAFLASGEGVAATAVRRLRPPSPPTLRQLAGGVALAAVAAAVAGLVPLGALPPLPAGWIALLALAFAPACATRDARGVAQGVLLVAVLVIVSRLWHSVGLVAPAAQPAGALAWAWALACIAVLQAAQATLPAATRASRRIQPWFHYGLHLDEAFTRFAFRIWPAPPIARETA